MLRFGCKTEKTLSVLQTKRNILRESLNLLTLVKTRGISILILRDFKHYGVFLHDIRS